MRRICYKGLMAVLGLYVLLVQAVQAAGYDEALAKFTSDQFPQIEQGILDLAAIGSPEAARLLEALNDGRLFFTAGKQVVFKEGNGVIDGLTAAKLDPAPDNLKTVRMNNRVRRTLESALGTLSLVAVDPVKRRAAAEAVFKARDPQALPLLETAIQKEKDTAIKNVMERARAAILVADSKASELARLGAVETLAERGDQEVMSLLASVRPQAPANLVQSIDAAIKVIERRLSLLSAFQNAIYGLSLGSVLLLAAIGLAITFGVMGIINMAHGEMVMLGAYTTFLVQEVIRAKYPALFDWSLMIALPLAFLVSALFGVIIERSILRFLYGRPLETLLATWVFLSFFNKVFGVCSGPPIGRLARRPSCLARLIYGV